MILTFIEPWTTANSTKIQICLSEKYTYKQGLHTITTDSQIPQTYLKTLNNEQDVSRYNPSLQGALSLEMDNRLHCVLIFLGFTIAFCCPHGTLDLNGEHLSQER